tara:strand:+ start:808 stop:1734 length:927 start_codon:yes stop_codon:yes gene_type:complete
MKPMELQETIEDLKAGDRLALSKFLTDVETSDNPMEMVLKLYNKVERITPIIGVTGFPGAGKSSLINSFIKLLRMKEKKVGVIAVDPSSLISGGSLLGDRTRMEQHSSDDKVFIRSLSSDGELGGLSHKSFLLSLVMATFDFDFIFVETVGTGQSESDITKLADFSILTLAPGLGDSIQAMKGGVLEVADLILVNKSDNPESSQTFHQLRSIIDTSEFPDGKNIKIMITNEKDQKQNTKIINYVESFVEKRMKLGKKKESHIWFVRQILYEKIEKSISNEKILGRLSEENFNAKDIGEIVERIITDLK